MSRITNTESMRRDKRVLKFRDEDDFINPSRSKTAKQKAKGRKSARAFKYANSDDSEEDYS